MTNLILELLPGLAILAAFYLMGRRREISNVEPVIIVAPVRRGLGPPGQARGQAFGFLVIIAAAVYLFGGAFARADAFYDAQEYIHQEEACWSSQSRLTDPSCANLFYYAARLHKAGYEYNGGSGTNYHWMKKGQSLRFDPGEERTRDH